MDYNIWNTPRQTFCWLDDKNVIVISLENGVKNGHCELLNTVSLVIIIVCDRAWGNFL